MRCTALLAIFLIGVPARAEDRGLIGHWKLRGDANDASGRGNHGRAFAVDLSATGPGGEARGAARFDGRSSWIEVPDDPALGPRQGRFHDRRLGAHRGIARRRHRRPGQQVRPGRAARPELVHQERGRDDEQSGQ